MYNHRSINKQIYKILTEINSCIEYLAISPCLYTRNMLIVMMRQKISDLLFLTNLQVDQGLPYQNQAMQESQQTFTPEQLTQYNGKNGQPAYIAVNGNIYNVTTSAAWAAATHFGLQAGKDLTQEFTNCHTGQQQILNTLPIVGRLRQ